MASLAAKLIRGSFFRVANPILNIAVSFFMIPFVIHTIGERWYGLWILTATMVGYFGFLDLGIATANERFVARALGQKDQEEINRVFSSSIFLFTLVGIASIIITAIIIIVCPFFVKNAADISTIRIVIAIIGFDMAQQFPIRGFNGFLYAHIRYDIAKLFLRTALIVLVLEHGDGIIALVVITLIVDLLESAAYVVYVLRGFPETRIRISYFAKHTVKQLYSYSIYSFISNVAKQLRFNLDSLVISGFLGLSSVTHYSIGSRIAGYYNLLVTEAISSLKPVFSSLEGQGAFDELREKYLFSVKLNTILSIFIGGSILIYGKAFILRWMGAGYLDSFHVLVVLALAMLCNTFQIPPATLLYGISKHRVYSFIVVAEGLVNLGLSLLLVKKYGIIGVALGTLIPIFVTSFFIVPYYANRVIQVSSSRYTKVLMRGLALGVLVHLASWLAVRGFITVSYPRILLLSSVTSIIFLTVNMFVLLSRTERRYFSIPF
jgi:O-antigen/teichoic acid export membrane protein